MARIDLNCDMGESFGRYTIGSDEEIISLITSANIACGFHAGDPSTMRKTIRLAMDYSVSIGAHPGLNDLNGFGRRTMAVSAAEVYDLVVYQIGAIYGFVLAEGAKLSHVKPHGALYNMAAVNQELAEAIAEAVYDINPELILYGLSGSEMIKAGKKIGLKTANEVFADRTYMEDGTLTPRSKENALIKDKNQAISQVLKMVIEQKVGTVSGVEVPISADTICIHGDGENAVEFAKKVRKTLYEHGVEIKAI
ncbi:5-oxoprolinase subunit PxpA [uncultured Metabacillus sp.]|uniref:LamB/YcsF family protein n=1 Tax=uncultured Metabacillus sp. TaxID=2860135 RepID=UPI0026077089|nr:5-oxoprolinase subunit PxpA [uncultured Metabacillus sp.]